MTLTFEVTKELKVDGGDQSYVANEDLSDSKIYLAVVYVGQASGQPKVQLPASQGQMPAGLLLNSPASGALAEIRNRGFGIGVAAGAFNSGIELAIDGTSGKLSAAASGDYVIGISREAAVEANHEVSVQLCSPYQKN